MSRVDTENQPQLFGHPTGLYTLFFAEMWERFSYYGMRALLILYMIKGFLGYGDKDANAVYGAYTALVYMTPFFGGMIADKLLGSRTSVVIGGLLMAIGQLLLTVKSELFFFTGLGLLISGNGFFKPNISTIVGTLYPDGSPKRDGGFTIFYIGINLGAAMAPLLCGYIGETYGWEKGFGLAAIGMLVGTAIFVAPNYITQILILLTSLASAIGLFVFNAGESFSMISNIFVAVACVISGLVAFAAIGRGGLPKEAGGPPEGASYYSEPDQGSRGNGNRDPAVRDFRIRLFRAAQRGQPGHADQRRNGFVIGSKRIATHPWRRGVRQRGQSAGWSGFDSGGRWGHDLLAARSVPHGQGFPRANVCRVHFDVFHVYFLGLL